MDIEKLNLKFERVVRKTSSGDLLQDLKDGYIYFDAFIDANGRKLEIEKRIRMDKPERMLNKFVTKIKALAEEQYKDQKYYNANKTPPAIETFMHNEEEVNEKMLPVFEEANTFLKQGNPSVLATEQVEL